MTLRIDENRIKKQAAAKELNFSFDRKDYEIVETGQYIDNQEQQKRISIQGRVTEIRKKGGIIFLELNQYPFKYAFIQKKDDEFVFEKFKELIDKGDLIQIFGVLDADNRIQIRYFDLLAKCLFILPKILNNPYLKNNFRFVEAVIDNKVADVINNQSKILKAVRNVLRDNGFDEFSTPIISTQYNGGAATPFEIHIRSIDKKGFLRVSSDIQLKMLIASGFSKIFEIGSQFRNEGLDNIHMPEFLMLEAYETQVSHRKLLNIVLSIFEQVAVSINGDAFFLHDNGKINCSVSDWEYVNARDCILQETGIDILSDEEKLKTEASNVGIMIDETASIATIVNKLIEKYILQESISPTIVEGLPYGLTPLIKESDKKGIANRYWLFARKTDFCDIGQEENDYLTQIDALTKQHENLRGKKAHSQINEDIKNIVAFGLPAISGMGMSLSRLQMIFANSDDIRESSAFRFK